MHIGKQKVQFLQEADKFSYVLLSATNHSACFFPSGVTLSIKAPYHSDTGFFFKPCAHAKFLFRCFQPQTSACVKLRMSLF